ncbi:MAG: ABC transporter substrate-binding protein [Bifidobacterium thermacidophilum]|nr:ABC transporter substrate-binding protein [Bifidobacterium thermacidophilum]
MTRRNIAKIATAIVCCTALGASMAACGASSQGSSASSWATITSASDGGGMDALVAAAKKEGELTLIACPDDWANWGKIISKFEDTYDITVNSTDPNASSAEEIKAADNLKGQSGAPDVFDLGATVVSTSTDHYAAYKVQAWDSIPDENKESTGLYTNDYTGVISIGYDSSKVPAPTSINDLLTDKYKGMVAINGDPTQSGSALAAVAWATLQNGGSLDDFSTGIDFYRKLQQAGNFLHVDATSATVASGETPVVIDWNYLNVAAAAGNSNYKTVVLPSNAYGSYYSQAINKDAPHPAAARLWEEFVYTNDVQNLFLQAGALPVLASKMKSDGTIDTDALEKAGGLPDDINLATKDQIDAANKLLAEQWSSVASS